LYFNYSDNPVANPGIVVELLQLEIIPEKVLELKDEVKDNRTVARTVKLAPFELGPKETYII